MNQLLNKAIGAIALIVLSGLTSGCIGPAAVGNSALDRSVERRLTEQQADETHNLTTNYESPCNNNERDKESDLCAQWTAALAAEKSALWSMISALVSIGGVLGLIYTITQTRWAVQSDRRPWLHIDKIAGQVHGSSTELYSFQLDFHIRNVGRTTATNISLEFGVFPSLNSAKHRNKDSIFNYVSTGNLPPDEPRKVCHLANRTLDQSFGGGSSAYGSILVKYESPDRTKHVLHQLFTVVNSVSESGIPVGFDRKTIVSGIDSDATGNIIETVKLS